MLLSKKEILEEIKSKRYLWINGDLMVKFLNSNNKTLYDVLYFDNIIQVSLNSIITDINIIFEVI
jgi:hypothetical protein